MTIFNPLRNDGDAAGTVIPTGSLFETGLTLLFWTKDRDGNILTEDSAEYIKTIEDYITTEHTFNGTTYEDFCFKVARAKNPPLATKILLENTAGLRQSISGLSIR